MNKQGLKKVAAGLVIVLSLFFGIGVISTPEAQAQRRDHRWDRDRNNRRDNDRDREWDRRRQAERARAIARARQRQRERDRYYRYDDRRNYPYYGNTGRYDRYGRYDSSEVQRGYRNGLKEGLDDAEDRDSFNPSRHSSYRDGNPSYRNGFFRGYEEGYRRYAYSRRW